MVDSKKSSKQHIFNDQCGIGQISLKPEQSYKQTSRRPALFSPSLLLGKEAKLTAQDIKMVDSCPYHSQSQG